MSNVYSSDERVSELEKENEELVQLAARLVRAVIALGGEVVIRPCQSKEWSDAEDPAHYQTGC